MELSSNASGAICGNLEIMGEILGFLHERGEDHGNPKSPSVSSKRDLLSACLVSKSFFLDTALNILWRHLDSLEPVLRLFPTFQQNKQSHQWFLTGTVRNDHLQRVLFYSRRIRSIRIYAPPIITDSLTILSSLMQPMQPFLPLTELIVKILPVKNTLHPMLFITPLTLTAVSITDVSPTSRVAVASLLRHLSSNHDSLKHLSLTGCIDSTFLPILLECTSMRSLTIMSKEIIFSAEYVRALSNSLPSLETLTLKLLRSNKVLNPVHTGASFSPAVFPSLRELTLTGDLPSISGILSTLKAPQLREITLSFSGPIKLDTPEAATFAECVAQVAKISGLEGEGHLRVIKISQTSMSSWIDMSAFDTLCVLRPTIQVFHLHLIRLHLETEKEYKNPLHTTRLVYPNLVDLRVTFQQSALPNGAHCTPMVLELLARVCPNLKTLHISVSAGDEDELDIDLENMLDIPPHGLQSLVFHHLPRNWSFSVSLAVVLVRYLDYLFPTLVSAEYCQEGLSESVTKWWKGVQDILKMRQGKENGRHRRLVAVD